MTEENPPCHNSVRFMATVQVIWLIEIVENEVIPRSETIAALYAKLMTHHFIQVALAFYELENTNQRLLSG
jgi:hypothetical protein